MGANASLKDLDAARLASFGGGFSPKATVTTGILLYFFWGSDVSFFPAHFDELGHFFLHFSHGVRYIRMLLFCRCDL